MRTQFIGVGDALVHLYMYRVPRYRYLYFVMALPSLCNCATEPLLLCD